MRYGRLALALTAGLMATTSLGGCVISDRQIFAIPAVGAATPTKATRAPAYDMDGSTLFDAYHAVQRYLSAHYSNASLVKVHALMVGTNAKIDRSSSWEFTYRIAAAIQPAVAPAATPAPTQAPVSTSSATGSPAPSPVASPAVVTAPAAVQYKLVKFTYTGKGDLLAPDEQPDTSASLQSLDFTNAILLGNAINTCMDIGMGVDNPGMEVTLRTTVNGGAVYEIDSGYATRQNPVSTVADRTAQSVAFRRKGRLNSYDNSYDNWDDTSNSSYGDGGDYTSGYDSGYVRPTPAPTPTPQPTFRYVRGKYLIDAYTGAIIDRPNNL